ncbi:unnamed protein product [Leptosia nina]|uniref:Uncharacterized protein n=1 Tax=Leptosia nina TaxID=320188 RepID=A0AAV1J0M3_9NEOP
MFNKVQEQVNHYKSTDDTFKIIYLPLFWRDRAVQWFSDFEMHLDDLGETELANIVVKYLNDADLALVTDITLNPPSKHYTAIRDRLTFIWGCHDERTEKVVEEFCKQPLDSRLSLIKLFNMGSEFSDFFGLLQSISSFVINCDANKVTEVKKNSIPLCYYHQRFGSEARSCLKPCGYTD